MMRSVDQILEDSQLSLSGKLLLLIEQGPRFRCGGNCELLQHLANSLRTIEVQEAGWR